jgi:hypothetical protein
MFRNSGFLAAKNLNYLAPPIFRNLNYLAPPIFRNLNYLAVQFSEI